MSSKSPDRPKKAEVTRRPHRLPGAAISLALVVLIAVGVLAVRQYGGMSAGIAAETAGRESTMKIGGPFTLVDQDGRTVTEANFDGRWLLVYFGFTFCPDVCPTALTRNISAIDLLGEQAEKITPVLISVDPQRDSPEKLKDYVRFFHPRLVGLTGTPQQIASVAKEYRVFYVKSPGDTPETYLVDHSSLTYLIGPDGKFVEFFSHGLSAEEVANRLKQRL